MRRAVDWILCVAPLIDRLGGCRSMRVNATDGTAQFEMASGDVISGSLEDVEQQLRCAVIREDAWAGILARYSA